MKTTQVEPVKIFIACASADSDLKDELKAFLIPSVLTGSIKLWDDFDVQAGQIANDISMAELRASDIILLLISHYALASQNFYQNTLKVALGMRRRHEALVVPILLRHCDYKQLLEGLKVLPHSEEPIVSMPDRDKALNDIVKEIKDLAQFIPAKKQFKHDYSKASEYMHQAKWQDAHLLLHKLEAQYQHGYWPERIKLNEDIHLCKDHIDREWAKIEMPQVPPDAPVELHTQVIREEPVVTSFQSVPATIPSARTQATAPPKKARIRSRFDGWTRGQLFYIYVGVVISAFCFVYWTFSSTPIDQKRIEAARKVDQFIVWQNFLTDFPNSEYKLEAAKALQRHAYRRDTFMPTLKMFKQDGKDIQRLLNEAIKKYPSDTQYFNLQIKNVTK